QFGKIQGHVVKMNRARIIEWRTAHERRSRMEKYRQAIFFAIPIYVIIPGVSRMCVLIERSQLHPHRAQLLMANFQLFHIPNLSRIYRREKEQSLWGPRNMGGYFFIRYEPVGC